MNRCVTTLTCLFLVITTVSAQVGLYPKGTAAVGMGEITTLSRDVWSAFMNPAGLGFLQHGAAGVQHEQRFSMSTLGINVAAVALPLLGGGGGIYLSNLGFAHYGENRFGLSMGRKLNPSLSIGGGVHINVLRLPEDFPNSTAISGDVGVQFLPIERLVMGVYISNVSFSCFNNENADELPVIINWGMGYHITENILLCAEMEKEVKTPLRVKAGSECVIDKAVVIRVGMLSAPFEIHFGAGYIYKKIHVDAAVRYHPVLGYSPQVGVNMEWGKR